MNRPDIQVATAPMFCTYAHCLAVGHLIAPGDRYYIVREGVEHVGCYCWQAAQVIDIARPTS